MGLLAENPTNETRNEAPGSLSAEGAEDGSLRRERRPAKKVFAVPGGVTPLAIVFIGRTAWRCRPASDSPTAPILLRAGATVHTPCRDGREPRATPVNAWTSGEGADFTLKKGATVTRLTITLSVDTGQTLIDINRQAK